MIKDQPGTWFLLQTKPAQEFRAERFLREWARDVLLPLGKTRSGPRPLFSGYIFGCFPGTFIARANVTLGVLHVVHFGITPAVVEDELIEEIKGHLDVNGLFVPTPMNPVTQDFRRGDRLKITAGAFKDRTGMFDCRLNGKQKAKILLDLVADGVTRWAPPRIPAGSIRATVDLGDLERMKAAEERDNV